MRLRPAALTPLLAVAAVAGCGGDDDEQKTPRADSSTLTVRACGPRQAQDEPTRFARLPGYPAQGEKGLVHDQETYRPGAQVLLLPVNRTRARADHGAPYSLERREGDTWTRLPDSGEAFLMYAMSVGGESVSTRCANALIPTTARPGRYRVTVGAFRTELTVAGTPLPISLRELALRETDDDPERETTVPDVEDNPSGAGTDAPEPGLEAVP